MAGLTFHPEKRPASFIYLFPLDGGRRFGTYVIDYAVDSAYLVDYVVADLGKEVVREVVFSYVLSSPMTPTLRTGRRMAPACQMAS